MGLRPMFPHPSNQPRCFSTAEPAFDFFGHQVYRGYRLVSTVFGEQVIAGDFKVNSRAKLTRRTIGTNLVQLHPCPQRTRSIPPHPANLPGYRRMQLVCEFNALGAD